MNDCFLGLDLGTSGCRGVAIGDTGAVLAEASTPLSPPRRAPDGSSRQAPALWWEAARTTLQGLAAALGSRRPRTLALDATATSLLLATPGGEPLGPALMYDDRCAADQAARVSLLAPPDAPVHGPSSSLSKLLFLLEEYPTRHEGTLALHQADWLTGRLCGRYGNSDWNNSLRLGYDPQGERWPDWLQRLGLDRATLPRVHRPGAPLGMLAPGLAADLGLPPDLTVCAGTTDSTASALAAGVERPGDGVTVLGSTLVVKVMTQAPLTDPAHGVYSHRLDDRWLAGGASNSGAAVLRRYFPDQRIRELTPKLRPEQPTGLHYYPLLRPGERFPVNDPELRPRLQPRPEDDALFLQGLLEGIADIEARGYELLDRLGAPALRRVISIGGGAQNPAWQRIRAHRLGVPLSEPRHRQAAYGAALLARRGSRWN